MAQVKSSSKKSKRIEFGSSALSVNYPDFLDIQLKSFEEFFQIDTLPEDRVNEGLFKVFSENFPITDTRNQFVLEFLDYFIDPPRYSIEECIERGLTYSVPLKAKLKLYCTDPEHEDFETIVQDVYLGQIPYMTPKGSFVVNGAERVVVSQLHRSPGVFFGQSRHANGTKLYSARVIPFKGSWIEFATDINGVMYAYIDRKKKLPVTTLLRAIGFESDKDILEIFGLADEIKVTKANLKEAVGRRLAARVLKTWVEDFVDEDTGEVVSIERNEVLIDRETVIEEHHVDLIVESGAKTVILHKAGINAADYALIYNTLQKDTSNSEKEAVEVIYRQLRNAEPPDLETARGVIDKLFFSEQRYDLGEVGRYRINKKLGLESDLSVRVLTKEDIIYIIKYLIELVNVKADVDDIDHLSNRRVRTVGEQLHAQFGVGLARMARTIRERMNVRDNEVFTPTDLINAKTLSSVINSFFGTNQLSQFMDQTNPLSEITHKRRMSALGPGGLSRERAGFEVRDVHYTHYGRLCTIETPEGGPEGRCGVPERRGGGQQNDRPGQRQGEREGRIPHRPCEGPPDGRLPRGEPQGAAPDGRGSQPDRLDRRIVDPLPGAQRRQPCADGLEHDAPGRAAAAARGPDRGHRSGGARGPRQPCAAHGRRRWRGEVRGQRAHHHRVQAQRGRAHRELRWR
jgi:DNA-directed RNA polymerase subunit beta